MGNQDKVVSKREQVGPKVKLDPHGEMLLRQYRELQPTLDKLAKESYDILLRVLREQGIYVTAIEYRVKTEKSLIGKLELKGAKYKSIDDITDLVGLRVITFYIDDVDKVVFAKQGKGTEHAALVN